MSRSTKGDTRECSVRIVDAVCILNEEQWRVCTFLECLSPESVVVITVVVCTGKGNIKESTTCKLCIEVDAVPCKVKVKTICKLRTVRATYQTLVIRVDLTVTVKVYILDISYIRTCTVPCGIVNLLLTLVKTVSGPCKE